MEFRRLGVIQLFWYFLFFFVSGFCSILYELVWLRLSMAQFGVNTATVSIVLSMFMAGLGLGSWACGELLRKHGPRVRFPILRVYALTELLIGVSAILVPYQLAWGRSVLESAGFPSSIGYYLASGIWIAISLLPWCALMGATIPIAMEAIRRTYVNEERRSFSFLYLANVSGAVMGAAVPLALIELFGFHGTLKVGSLLNGLLALCAATLTLHSSGCREAVGQSGHATVQMLPQPIKKFTLLGLLFLTGLTGMGMEVAWIRQFTPYEGTVVYAFAKILVVYLGATFAGSSTYRRWSAKHQLEPASLWVLLGLVAVLSPVTADPNLRVSSSLFRVAFGIAPFTGLLGFVTPMLVDRWSAGDPERAGTAYAVNILGCILGPLLSGFVLLPHTSERWAVFVLALPWLLFGAYSARSLDITKTVPNWRTRTVSYALLPAALGLVLISKDFEQGAELQGSRVLRDHTATVVAFGTGMEKRLLTNGVGMTSLTPITKMMAHLPMAMLGRPPQNALVICFGMGTTYRSLMSWDIPVTAVELVPSVPRMFSYYHSDAAELFHSPLSRVVIDDGRRYLERTPQQYDVIVIDPPPPVEAAGSSLLYSKEFYSVAKRRLRPDGILQQWLPSGDAVVLASVARALKESFPYVRVFHSVEGWGYHFTASRRLVPKETAEELLRRMPLYAIADLMEWGPEPDGVSQFWVVLQTEFPLDQLIEQATGAPALTDDRPLNEYYALRRRIVPQQWQHLIWREDSDSTVIAARSRNNPAPAAIAARHVRAQIR